MNHDGCILSATRPSTKRLSFWISSRFASKSIFGMLLAEMGAVRIHRLPQNSLTSGRLRENNNVVAATVAKLKSGWDFVIFPEGHSSTNHKILQVLNGAAWTLMEYSKTHPSDLQPVIIPVCLVYSDKSTFRSHVSSVLMTED
jgi:1-acyl-sn-glycerol-3-phosphate acyltransferase